MSIIVGLIIWGIVVGLCCASGNTLCWLLLLVYEGPRTTHFTGYCCGLCEPSGNTRYWASLGLMWGAFKIIFLKNSSRKVSVSVSPPKSEYPLTNKITWHCFPVSQLPLQTCHNPTNLIFTNLHLPPNRP
jgi:hypothetical protein